MDTDLARIIVIAIASVGTVVWLAAVAVMARASRERQARIQLASERFEMDGFPGRPGDGSRSGFHSASPIVGEVEVQGKPEELSAKLASLLARDGLGPIGPVKILSRNEREIWFESAGPGVGQAHATVRRGRFRLEGFGTRTRVEYALDAPSGRVLLWLGWGFVALGLAALVIIATVLLTFIVVSPSPAWRGQAVQMVQAVHFLWPPFLFAFLARQPEKLIRGRVEAMVHNLPYS
jgi:hypothetical protein